MRSSGSSSDSKRTQIFLVSIFCIYSCFVMTDYFQKAQTFSTSYQYSKAVPKYSTSHIHLPSLDELRFDKSKVMNNYEFDDVLMFDDYYSYTTEELQEEEEEEVGDDEKSDDIKTTSTSLRNSNSTVSKNETSIDPILDLNSTAFANLTSILVHQNLTNITNVTSDGG